MISITQGRVNKWLLCLGLAVLIGLLSVSGAIAQRVTITYWEKWTGFEGEAMKAVVDDFNASQDKIFVEALTVTSVDIKIMTAIAGGNPPDIAGLWTAQVVPWAMKRALIPLDDYIKKAGIKRESYIAPYWDLQSFKGQMWALPSTVASIALHYNKGMFKEAGLDPNKPPVTIKDLELYNDKLTKRDADGNITQMGHNPTWPGWWKGLWGSFFGGRLYDPEAKKITADDPNNIRAYEWIESFAKKYGVESLQSFSSGYGAFSSPTNPFLAGKLAMVFQGVWMANFIQRFAPKMEWGAAPFPYGPGGKPNTTLVETDILAIPAGAKHPDEAFEFIKYVQTQKAMEKLALGHLKHTALKASINPDFIENHPNPYIRLFFDLALSPNAYYRAPQVPIWGLYAKELQVAFDNIMLRKIAPKEALEKITVKMQKELDKYKGRL